ncbi:glycosyltransferase WbuB [Shewanella colwelliana]|uniref:Glycosyltransferase WbuB n=1 Tax=Shewanella colwelliana TaxID=23 RepID=A0A1E5IWP7_SHECO|nr:glycosyltransferase family 4 protein [Shewanella colwelliana]OEG74528.1 glycosyltransferase WbuB [Shewanella colwelliana]
MKILLLTQWFDPEPTFKGLLFAQALRNEGNEVEVLTGFPNYPGGKVYEGYKISLYQREVIDGITVHRVPLYPSHGDSAIKRIFNYASFAASSTILGLLKTRGVDIIYSYHPPLTTSLAAVLLGMFKRVPFVVDIQDLWPDTLSATGMVNNKKVLRVVDRLCSFVYRNAAKIVVLSPGFKNRLIEKGVSENKVEVIYNWCDEEVFLKPSFCDIKLPDNGNLNVVFAGNLGFAQGLSSIVGAAKELEVRNVPVNIVFVGDGVSKLSAIDLVEDDCLENVFFLPRVPMNQVGNILNSADVLLVHLTDNDLFSITIPSKTQAYLAVGKPIVMAVNGDASDLILAAKAGIVSEANCSKSLADAVEKMTLLSSSERNVMALNAREFYKKQLSLAHGVKKFMKLFNEVTHK